MFSADDYSEEIQLKVLVNLTLLDLVRELKQGEILTTEWLEDKSHDAEFRIIVQGRRVGVGEGNKIIDPQDGKPLIISG